MLSLWKCLASEAARHEEWSDYWATEMWAEQDKETSGDHLAKMTSMSGFKFAVFFLFNSATEALATTTRRAHEVTILSILWTIQPHKLCSQKASHVWRMTGESVNYVHILLNQVISSQIESRGMDHVWGIRLGHHSSQQSLHIVDLITYRVVFLLFRVKNDQLVL